MTTPDPEKPLCKIIRLITGETLIAGLSKIKSEFVLNRPMVISSEDIFDKAFKLKKTTVMLRPWIEYSSDENLLLPKHTIMTIAVPDTDMSDMYELAKKQEDKLNTPPEATKAKSPNKKATKIIKALDPQAPPDIDDEYDQTMQNPNEIWKRKPRFDLDNL